MMDKPNCGDCRFYKVDPDPDLEGKSGECRRRSPAVGSDRYDHGFWPRVMPEFDWCGEHEARPVDIRKEVETLFPCMREEGGKE